jgi:hypothetical protein
MVPVAGQRQVTPLTALDGPLETDCGEAGGGKTAGGGVATPATGTTVVVATAGAGAAGLGGGGGGGGGDGAIIGEAAVLAWLITAAGLELEEPAAGAVTGSNIGTDATGADATAAGEETWAGGTATTDVDADPPEPFALTLAVEFAGESLSR